MYVCKITFIIITTFCHELASVSNVALLLNIIKLYIIITHTHTHTHTNTHTPLPLLLNSAARQRSQRSTSLPRRGVRQGVRRGVRQGVGAETEEGEKKMALFGALFG